MLVPMLLAGCMEQTGGVGAALSGSGAKTKEERQLEAEARSLNQVTKNIIVKNTVEGAVIGAAAGCGIALLLGGDGGDCAKGAAAGGVIGGVGGNAVGRQAAQKKVELVQRDKVLANLRGVSQRLNGVETRLNRVLNSQNAELRSLRRQVNAQQVSKSEYDARVRAINSNRQTVKNELQKSENNIVKTRNEIRVAQQKGQSGLVSLDKAAASNQSRLARNRQKLRLIQ
ncbi:MAG TPA: hypothetical protein VJ929_07080 [Roseovarius sp.]|nr:hypothetical protein [Roseovarius sp.]